MEKYNHFGPLGGQRDRIRIGNGETTISNGVQSSSELPALEVDCSEGEVAESMAPDDFQKWLDDVQEKIANWDPETPISWNSEPERLNDVLRTIDEVRQVAEDLRPELQDNVSPRAHKIQAQASEIVESAMEKFEDEFIRILVRSRLSPDLGRLSFQSTEEDHVDRDDNSFRSSNDGSFDRRLQSEISRTSSNMLFEPVDPAAISDLRSIADLMFRCTYNGECLQAYITIRKAVSEDCFSLLRLENLSIQELVAMTPEALHPKIKKWIQAVRAFALIYLPSERKLCDGIFDSAGPSCFARTTMGTFFKILRYGVAIAISPPEPEKLFNLLEMYECLAELMPDLAWLFSDVESVIAECHEFLARLGESIVACVHELKEAISNKPVTSPLRSGGPFNITRYVMNYLSAMADYSSTLCSLFRRHGREQDVDAGADEAFELRRGLLSLISVLEEKITEKSRLYTDEAKLHFFIMNNVHYMVSKVKGCELQVLLGDGWVKEQQRRVRRHSREYLRISWNPILHFFKDEGLYIQGASRPSRAVLRERFRNFNHAFEEIYRIQTEWLIPEERLRDDLAIAISQHVLLAYGNFRARHQQHLDSARHRDSCVKFTVEDLQSYVLDLFRGSAKILR